MVKEGASKPESSFKESTKPNDVAEQKPVVDAENGDTAESRAEERRRKRKSKWTENPKKTSSFTQKTAAEIQADLLAQHQQAAAASAMANQQQRSRIYIGSLDFSLNEHDMREVFSPFGEITNIDMPKEGNRSKGYCFIEYANVEHAELALQTMQNFTLKGRIIKVGRPTASAVIPALPAMLSTLPSVTAHLPSAGQAAAASGVSTLPNGVLTGNTSMPVTVTGGADMNRIYIGNVPYTFTAEDIRKIFTVFGTILSCQLIPSAENPGTHRGYGFLEFSSNAEAKMAIETMNGFEVQGKQLKVNYSTQLHTRPTSTPTGPNMTTAPAPMPSMNASPVTPGFTGVVPSASPVPSSGASMTSPMNPRSITGSNLSPLGAGSGSTGYERATTPVPGSVVPGTSPSVQSAAPVTSSNVILMSNMINPSEIDKEFPKEVRTEASKYGDVDDVRIQIVSNEVRVFVKYQSASAACVAVPSLNGRWFSGRLIKCKLYNQDAYEAGNYEL